jgi:proteic killer suppression protein
VNVLFANPRLKAFFESQAEMRRAYGEPRAKKLMARLADLRAASVLEDLRRLPGACRELDEKLSGQLALNLGEGKCLIFEPSSDSIVAASNGGLDWRQVDAVRVLDVRDY